MIIKTRKIVLSLEWTLFFAEVCLIDSIAKFKGNLVGTTLLTWLGVQATDPNEPQMSFKLNLFGKFQASKQYF